MPALRVHKHQHLTPPTVRKDLSPGGACNLNFIWDGGKACTWMEKMGMVDRQIGLR